MMEKTGIAALLDIMAQLRTPETGCPWDLEQDFSTIAPYTIEEAYEVADAIERNNMNDLRDELGDLLLQVVFHSRMAEEAGHFDFQDVVQSICDKMIRRHPHVFGDSLISTADAQTQNWEDIKAAERAAKGETDQPASVLDDVAHNLPALMRAEKLQKRAARIGFDWPDINQVLDKAEEELAELRAEVNKPSNTQKIAGELGDILFVYANLARHLKVNPEESLRMTNAKFVRRFHHVEQQIITHDEADRTLALLDSYWNEAKKAGL